MRDSHPILAVLIALVLTLWPVIGPARAGGAITVTGIEMRAVQAHGPWPVASARDPSNPVSGNADAVTLGRRLFFDARLSPSGRVACSSCHRPERGWTDGRPRGKGLAQSRHNTPSLYDIRLNRRFGWRAERDSLWAQSIRPILDPAEMGSSAQHVQTHVAANADIAALYEQAFGRAATATSAPQLLDDIGKGLAAFQETIVSGRTAFDDFRDALARGEAAASRYPEPGRRGLTLFVGRAGCATCHSGPAFSDGELHPIAQGRERVRTPTLRNLAHTAPYLHDGSAPTLANAIRAHENGPRLGKAQVGDLVAFLRTLSFSP